jgi:hypothetical protein
VIVCVGRIPGRTVESTILVTDSGRSIVTEDWTPFECPAAALADADLAHVDHVGYSAVQASDNLSLSVDGGRALDGRSAIPTWDEL